MGQTGESTRVDAPHAHSGGGAGVADLETQVSPVGHDERRASTGDGDSSTLLSPLEAMHRDEIARVNIFSRLMIGLTILGVVLIQFLGGDPLARKLFAASLALTTFNYGALYWLSRDPDRYSEGRVGVVAQLCILPGAGTLYYFGVFSPAAVVMALGLYVYSLGASFRWSAAALATLSAAHAALAALIIGGVIDDRGLIRGDHLSAGEQLLIQGAVLSLYGLAYVLGRATREKTLGVITQLEEAVRRAGQRDALLREAQLELDRARRVGDPGRYTDLVLGSFKLGVVIGRGAMGEVYRATRESDGAPAAVKVMHPHTREKPNMMARFLREVETARALSSPHVASVIEVSGRDAPTPYLAMELLRGADLGAHLRDHHRMKLRDVVELVTQVAAGLAAAHDAGIVHRDLKPQNVFRTEDPGGRPVWKILDFGVSKLAGQTGTLTKDHVVGTPAYMAPEQARGRDVDDRADVYALGAIAYRCATGRPPFSARDPVRLMYMAAHEMPPRPGALADLPADVDRVLALAMAKRPGDRPAGARELADALTAAARGALPDDVRRRADALVDARPWSQ